MNAKVPIRPAVASLPSYVPGARPGVGRRAFKLSSNENPFPPLPGVLSAVADAAADLHRYPDMFADELIEALAACHGVEPARIAAGTGSVAVLGHILTAVCRPGDQVLYPWRSFEAYPLLVALAGADSVQVPITDDAARHDFAALASAITDRTRVILLCSPNNPTGPAIRQGELADFLGAVPSDVLVVLDEAYVQFITDPEAARFEALDKDFPNLVSLRTFSKAYGLAGLRVGYAIARPRIAEAVRAASTPFGVNAAAQLAARVSLGMGEAMRERVAVIVGQRERMAEALRGQGWNLPDAQGNFVWLPLGAQSAPFAQAAAAAGILVRPFDGEGVRVTAGEPEAIDALLEITPSWL